MGKPANISSSMAAAAGIEHYAGLGPKIEGSSNISTNGLVKMVVKQPYGVVAAIVPW